MVQGPNGYQLSFEVSSSWCVYRSIKDTDERANKFWNLVSYVPCPDDEIEVLYIFTTGREKRLYCFESKCDQWSLVFHFV